MIDNRLIETRHGPARIEQRRAPRPWATLVLTHGAGGGNDRPELQLLAHQLPGQGISVALVELPWRVAGRRVAPAAAILDETFAAAMSGLRPRTPLVVGGRSTGGRVGCRTARALGATGVLALSFPLHPPGRPERSRAAELLAAGVPTLVVQGELDPFGAPHEFPLGLDMLVVPGADHSLAVHDRDVAAQADADAIVLGAVRTWLGRRLRHDEPGQARAAR